MSHLKGTLACTRTQGTVSRRGFLVSGAAASAAVALPTEAFADPVVALWGELEAAQSVRAEKIAFSDACAGAIPEPYKCGRNDLYVSIPSRAYDEKADGSLVYRETTKARVDRKWLEWALKQNASAEHRGRQRDAMARLEKLEVEWEMARADWFDAEEEVERADLACDAIEDRIVEAEATSPEGVVCKLRLGLRRNEIRPDDAFNLQPFESAIRDILRVLPRPGDV